MAYLFFGLIILLAATLIYYLVFFGLVYYWHERKETVVIVPLIYTFEFFLIGFLVVGVVCLTLQHWQEIKLLINTVYGSKL